MLTETGCLDGTASCLLAGLSPNRAVSFRVRGVSTAGDGNFTAIGSASTLSATVPAAPAGVRALFTGSDFLQVGWDAPPACSADELTFSVE